VIVGDCGWVEEPLADRYYSSTYILDMYNSGQHDASIDWHALHHERPHRDGQTSRRGIGSRTRGIRMYWMRMSISRITSAERPNAD
jgi:hypothetical protein